MRVTLLGRDFPPRVGGIADHTDHLAHALAARGHAVSVVCSPPGDARADVSVRAVVQGWRAHDVPAIARAVAATEPDRIIWQYNPFSIGARGLAPSAAPRIARALAGIAPLTVLFHELWFPWGRAGARGVAWAVVQRAQARGVLHAATSWIVTTPSREEALHARDASKTHRIPVGTNVDPVAAGKQEARRELGISADAFVVAHLGSAGPGRDLGPMFDALATLRREDTEALLMLAGDTGPLRIPPEVAPYVRAPGPEPLARLSLALRAADVYLHADPVGASAGRRTTLVAALAHGLPILAYRGPDRAPELDGAIVEVARDACDVADALRRFATDPPMREELGARAARIFEDHFSWRRIAEDVEGVLLGR